MNLEDFKKKLIEARNYLIDFGLHVTLHADSKNVSLEEVEENLRSPGKLAGIKQEDNNKFICLFKLSNTLTHKYVIRFKPDERIIKVITVIKIRNRWQKKVRKHGR